MIALPARAQDPPTPDVPAASVPDSQQPPAPDTSQPAEPIPPADSGVSRALSNPWTWVILVSAAIVIAGVLVRGLMFPPDAGPPARDVTPHGWGVWIAGAFVVWASFQMGSTLVQTSHLAHNAGSGIPLRITAVSLLVGGGIAAGVGLLFLRVLATAAPNAGLGLRWSDIPLGILAGILALPVVLSASMLATWARAAADGAPPQSVAHDTLRTIVDHRADPWVWLIIFGVVVLVPLWEETCYRGLLQSGAARIVKRRWLAVLLVSGVFALVHASVTPWHALPTLFVLGLSMGVAFERTRRLGVPIVMHALFNLGMTTLALARG